MVGRIAAPQKLIPVAAWATSVRVFHHCVFIPSMSGKPKPSSSGERGKCSSSTSRCTGAGQLQLPASPILETWHRCLAAHPNFEVSRLAAVGLGAEGTSKVIWPT